MVQQMAMELSCLLVIEEMAHPEMPIIGLRTAEVS